ncbi:AAA family ATPase [Paracoccus sanguinis]|uniref:AAA domain-containing protein n=1 Tax=Paracoccus sanguinis TaxID=1545044 RepID=A0A1H2QGM5_9RHOB|nr:AAA family ATPase [Paracoccus sanguinis]SDW06383.1 AAA domain-containing protein [Paracoccus sanguinis]
MALPIIGADERLAQRKGIKGVIFGRSGIGKTSLLWTLNAPTTLFLDLEAGDLAVEGLEIDTLRPRTWKECRDFAVFIGGRTRRCARISPTARRISTRSAGATAIRR